MRRLGPESTHTSAIGASVAFPPPTAAAQRRAVRWALMSQCTATAVATILILPARERQRGNTYNELLKLLPELCTPVTTIVGLPTTTNVAWDGTDTRPQQRAGAPTSSSSPTQRPHGASLDTSRNRGLLAALGGMRCTPDQGRMRVCYEMQPSNTKHLGTCVGERVSRRTRGDDDAGGGILCMTKDFRARERQQLEPTAAPPTTEHDWPEGLGTDRPRPAPPYTSGTPSPTLTPHEGA
jgi:hypothetical protein